MRIHRITLRNYRGVRECTIEPSLTGVTIIEGDNEVGKSSVAEALDLLLHEPDSSGKAAVRAVQPIGRDVGAEVELELTCGPYRLVYAKRWHKDKMTTLQVFEPSREHVLGREAHDRVVAILDETLDRGLWDALRVTQGAALAQGSFGNLREGSLGAALDVAADGARAGEAEESLWERITAERDRYWTKTLQPAKERKERKEQLEECEESLALVEEKLRALDASIDEISSLSAAIASLDVDLITARTDAAHLQEQVASLGALRHELERAQADASRADAEHRAAAGALTARTALQEAVQSAAAELAHARAVLEKEAPEVARLDAALRVSAESVTTHEDELLEARTVRDAAVQSQRLLKGVVDLDQMRERHGRIVNARAQIVDAEAALHALHVDDAALEQIETAHLAVVQARAAAQGAATLSIEALTDLDLRLDGDALRLVAGQTELRHATADITVELPEVARFTVRPSAEGRSLADGLARAEEQFASACSAAQVQDVDGARRAHAARLDATRDIAAARERIAADLRDLTIEELEGFIKALEASLTSLGLDTQHPELDTRPDALAAASDAVAAAEQLLSDAEATLERSRASLNAAEAEHSQLSGKLAGYLYRVERAEAALSAAETAVTDARAVRSDESLTSDVQLHTAAVAAAAAAVDAARRRLDEANADSLDEQRRNAEAVVHRLALEVEQKRDRRTRLQAMVEALGEQGLAHEYDTLSSEIVHLRAEHEAVEARAAAARLLFETFHARREEARSRYAAPLRGAIEQLGRIVFGPSLEIELDDDLSIRRRTLDGATLDFAALSTGAQEQLGILGRLACATLVGEDAGVPVVFDDTLGWTDPNRLRAMGAAINAAGRTCQVIILTCTPGRYASVGGAETIRLPQ